MANDQDTERKKILKNESSIEVHPASYPSENKVPVEDMKVKKR